MLKLVRSEADGQRAEAIAAALAPSLAGRREFGVVEVLEVIGIALRACGVVQGGAAGTALLEQAVEVLAASGARPEHARALVELGCALRRANRRAAARSRLEEGLRLAVQCGDATLVERAELELEIAGSRRSPADYAGTAALTRSERRVCELAARGMSNPEIAQTLFVSRATVESHLHHAYRKLDITGRTDLATALAA